MIIISFQLTMPNNNSWNGKWTGADKLYYEIKTFPKKSPLVQSFMEGKESKNWYYNFGDGYGANVKAEIIDANDATKRRKVSSGFCGYNWMIHAIIHHNKILIVDKLVNL